MKFLLVRLALWFFTLAISPIPFSAFPRSFAVEVLERFDDSLLAVPVISATNSAALPPEERTLGAEQERHDWTERILLRLKKAEIKEPHAWRRDDYGIAWITTCWSQYGIPDWSLHARESPYVAATWQVLHCHPDQVWPNIVATRKLKLGSEYSLWYDEAGNLRREDLLAQLEAPELAAPKKPVQSVKLRAASRKNAAA